MGVTANTPAFQIAFTASIMSVLPTGSTVTITSVKLFWSDGTVTASRRRELLQATVVGVQVAYSIVTAASAGSTSSIEALLANPATVSAMSTNLAATIPEAVVQAPLVLVPTSAPTVLPTFSPSSSPIAETAPVLTPVSSPVVSSPIGSPVSTPVTVPTTSTSTTVSVTQSVSSATLTVAQAQSGSFSSAFVAGIQGAVPGVTVTVTSVTGGSRRSLLASVVVSYTAVSTTTDAATLTAGLSNAATIAAIGTSLSTSGYAGVTVSSPVIVPAAPTTSSSSGGGGAGSSSSSSSSGSSSGSAGGGNIAVIAGAVVGGLVLIAVAVLVPVLLMRNKKPASNRFELTPEVDWDPKQLVSLDQQQPQHLRHHLETSMIDGGGQGYMEGEPVYSPYHQDQSVNRSEKSMSSIDNKSVGDGSEQNLPKGAAARPRERPSLVVAGIGLHVQSNTDNAQEQRQATDVNNNNNNNNNNSNSNTSIPLISPPVVWSHALARMSQLRPKSVNLNYPSQTDVMMTTQLVTGVEDDSDDFRASFVAAVASAINAPDSVVSVVLVRKVNAGVSVVYKIATNVSDVNSIEQTLSSGVAVMSEELQKSFPGITVASPKVVTISSPNRPLPHPRAPAIKSTRLLPPQSPQPQVSVQSPSVVNRPRQGPGLPPLRPILPEETQWTPPSWSTLSGKDIRVSDEEMHLMDVNAARRHAAHRHSVTSIDSQYTDVWKHTRHEEIAYDDDASLVSFVACEEYEDKERAELMEKLYAQDDEFNDVMAEIMRAEVRYPRTPSCLTLTLTCNVYVFRY